MLGLKLARNVYALYGMFSVLLFVACKDFGTSIIHPLSGIHRSLYLVFAMLCLITASQSI